MNWAFEASVLLAGGWALSGVKASSRELGHSLLPSANSQRQLMLETSWFPPLVPDFQACGEGSSVAIFSDIFMCV